MACRGLFIAITNEEAAALLAKKTHDERVEYVINNLEEVYFGSERVCETDKAWDAIHRAFDGGSELSFDTSEILKLVVLGGKPLHSEDDYVIVLKTPAQVHDAAAALEAVDEPAFRKRYFAIDPDKYGLPVDEQDFGYSWRWLEQAKQFYRRTAATGHSVIFSVDQ